MHAETKPATPPDRINELCSNVVADLGVLVDAIGIPPGGPFGPTQAMVEYLIDLGPEIDALATWEGVRTFLVAFLKDALTRLEK